MIHGSPFFNCDRYYYYSVAAASNCVFPPDKYHSCTLKHRKKYVKSEKKKIRYDFWYTQERMKVREVIPHIGPIPIVIPLKLFLEGIDFLADNVTSRVTCLSPFLILQRLHVISIIHFHKKKLFLALLPTDL